MNEQIDLFSYSMPTFKINKPVRLIELFAGIGSQAKALENLGVPFEHWFVSEIDKYAIASYNAVHGTNFEPNDIQEIHAADLKIAERERVPIVDHTKMGYTMASDGDGIDLGLHRKNHRGTVKHGISHTIKTEIDCGVIEIENKSNRIVKHKGDGDCQESI